MTTTQPVLTDRDREFVAAMRAVVAEFGRDYIYEASPDFEGHLCEYVRGGKPSCLIAQVLYRIGVPLDFLAQYEGESVVRLFHEDGEQSFLRLDEDGSAGPFSHVLIIAAWTAQQAQDGSRTWGEALDAFEDRLRQEGIVI